MAMIVVVRDHRVLRRYAYTLALAGLFFLILPIVLPARFSEVNGARIWIRLAGFSIQPGEFAKILLTIFAASYLVDKRDVLSLAGKRFLGIDFPRGRDLGPLLAAWLICIGVLIGGHDLGTSLMFFGLFVVLLYVATERVSWVIVGVMLFAFGAWVAYQLFGNVQTRVGVWLHLFSTVHNDDGYQLRQSLFGLGTGGLFGTGLGAGHPELVPLPATDYIISSFGEELGLFGLVALLVIYVLFIARGFAAALAVRDSFGKLLAAGLSFLVGLQLFVVVAGVSRLLPETGLTTPFLSYGGSSLIANYALLALLLRVSDSARRPSAAGQPGRKAEPGHGRDDGGDRAVNRQIRRVAARRRRAHARLVDQPELRAGRQERRLPQQQRQPPGDPDRVLDAARADRRAGQRRSPSRRRPRDELKYVRTYSNGPVYAPVTGFYSLIYGKPYGLESAEDGILGGTDSRLFGSRLGDILTGRDAKGGSVVTTLNAAAQQAAYTAMSKQKGAVVAMDPTTGAILAAVSLPSYDPNMLSSHDTAAITAYWKSLNPDDPQSALVNRAFNQTYAPGSVMKVITSAAALKKGVNQNDTIPAPNSYWPLGGSGPCPKTRRRGLRRELRRRDLRQRHDGHHGVRVRQVVQHRVRRAGRREDRRQRAGRRGEAVRPRHRVAATCPCPVRRLDDRQSGRPHRQGRAWPRRPSGSAMCGSPRCRAP